MELSEINDIYREAFEKAGYRLPKGDKLFRSLSNNPVYKGLRRRADELELLTVRAYYETVARMDETNYSFQTGRLVHEIVYQLYWQDSPVKHIMYGKLEKLKGSYSRACKQ